MRWVLAGLAVIVVTIAAVMVVGMLLPRDHVATRTARIAAPRDSIWRVLTTPAEYPSWRRDVARVELLPAQRYVAMWREHSRQGAITMAIESESPPQRLVTRIADTTLPFGGSWELDLAADGSDACRVTVTERGSVYNPVFRFVSRFVMGHTATIDAYLRALGTRYGQDVVPTTAIAVTPVSPVARNTR
jgi:uncharacterized protein YndB with AHSA1/START domain